MDNFIYTKDKINAIDLRGRNIFDTLMVIEKKPMLWLQKRDIYNLRSFLSGWIVGRNSSEDERVLNEFEGFVSDYYGTGDYTGGWCNIIAEHSNNEDTFAEFYIVFKKFKGYHS